jgi:hypothetical protein
MDALLGWCMKHRFAIAQRAKDGFGTACKNVNNISRGLPNAVQREY